MMHILLLVVVLLVIGLFFYANVFDDKETVEPAGKAVLITGCDSGFGYELALRANDHGFLVFAGCLRAKRRRPQYQDKSTDGDRDYEGGAEARAEAEAEAEPSAGAEGAEEEEAEEEGAKALARGGCHVFPLDVTKQEDVDAGVEFVNNILTKEGASLWAVVNNAGIAFHCELEWCSANDLTRLLDVNAIGPFRVAKAFLPALRRSPPGSRIVNVASAAAYFTFPGLTGYAMSKHACRSLSDGMRREWNKFQIQVSCFEPTLYTTNICNSDALIKKLNSNWSELTKDSKILYGDQYRSSYEEMIAKHYRTNGRIQIWEVIEDLMDSISRVIPKRHYHPGFLPKIRLFIFRCIPEFIVDKLMSGPAHMPVMIHRNR